MRNIYFLFLAALVACQNAPEVEQTPEQTDYAATGDAIAKSAEKALGSKLKAALQMGGVKNAISYCSVNAMPLTDSLKNAFQVDIKRTSTKIRNPKNTATEVERQVLEIWETKMANQGSLSPVVFEEANEVHYYKPIFVKPLCTTCHGVPGKTLTPETQALLAEKYPNDAAINYSIDQLRGMWHIILPKKEVKLH